jgi:hypothetical protein
MKCFARHVSKTGLIPMLLAGGPAHAEEKFPLAVIKQIQELENDCKDPAAAKSDAINIKTPLSVVKKGDYNGDGVSDYLFDDSSVDCEAGDSFRHGFRAAYSLYIFVGEGHSAIRAYSDTVWEYETEKKAGAESVWVIVGGKGCGDNTDRSFAETKRCARELVWNKTKKKFEMAPMSQKKMIK